MEQTRHYSRNVVIVFVDDFDPSAIAALRYARRLRPTTCRWSSWIARTGG
jgi:hypothetical protein